MSTTPVYFAGIDIGSTASKTVVLKDGKIEDYFVLPTGWNGRETANAILEQLKTRGYADAMRCVATGYGRICVDYADKIVTEITCHGKGGWAIFKKNMTIIDVGGQDTKMIKVIDGQVADFLMNDKCAAGTGRFLEMMAKTLGLSLEEMSVKGLEWKHNIVISSMCTVFAESEVISLIADNHTDSDIIHGLNQSIAGKTAAMAARAKGQPPYMMTGGVARNRGVVQALEEKLGAKLFISENPDLCGALGAALFALHGD